MSEGIEELDVVRLRKAAGGWPAGTEATVLEDFGRHLIVEVDDEAGDHLNLPLVRRDAVELVWKAKPSSVDA